MEGGCGRKGNREPCLPESTDVAFYVAWHAEVFLNGLGPVSGTLTEDTVLREGWGQYKKSFFLFKKSASL